MDEPAAFDLAASARRAAADPPALMAALATRLEGALPGRMEVEWMQHEAAECGAEGVVGMDLHEGSQNWQPHVIEFFPSAPRSCRSPPSRTHRPSPTRSSCFRSIREDTTMSIVGRAAEIFQAKTHTLLNALEDPNETLDLSCGKMLTGLQDTERHLADVVAQQQSLARQIGTEQFSTRKEVMKTTYTAEQAQVRVRVTHSLTGIGRDTDGVPDAMRRAQDRVHSMRDRADAMDGLIEGGVLRDPLDNRSRDQRELAAIRATDAVDDELRRLKSETTRAIEGPAS